MPSMPGDAHWKAESARAEAREDRLEGQREARQDRHSQLLIYHANDGAMARGIHLLAGAGMALRRLAETSLRARRRESWNQAVIDYQDSPADAYKTGGIAVLLSRR